MENYVPCVLSQRLCYWPLGNSTGDQCISSPLAICNGLSPVFNCHHSNSPAITRQALSSFNPSRDLSMVHVGILHLLDDWDQWILDIDAGNGGAEGDSSSTKANHS
mmetsp:Transcript_7795/g.10388  ORF Transcript_7795/g.10388 Transcript_7795/m.10388 type:complete len:106 (+) Transcript_7795:320-637(+)